MHNRNGAALIIFTLLSFCIFSQTYVDDTLAIRAILDANGLNDIPVSEVSDTTEGRVVLLDLEDRNLSVLPAGIGKLDTLLYLFLNQNS